MNAHWDRNAPIERQLRDRAAAMILDGSLRPGDALPSVPSVAADFRVNPAIVAGAYRQLVDEELVVDRPGQGLVVSPRAGNRLRRTESERFFRECWPAITACMQRLGIEPPGIRHAGAVH